MEEFKYQQGWSKNKDNVTKFDITKLPLQEQCELGECLGMVYDLASGPCSYKNTLRLYPWDKRQIDFLSERLNKPKDFNYWEDKDSRYSVNIKNKTFNYFFEKPFALKGPKVQRAILSSLITDSVLRITTNPNNKVHRKVVFITKNEEVSNFVKTFLDINTKDVKYEPLDYLEKGRQCYSVWFYAPLSLKPYILNEFNDLIPALDKLPNFDTPEGAWIVLAERANFRRMKSYNETKRLGLLDITAHRELETEFYRVKNELREAEGVLTLLQHECTTLDSFNDENYRRNLVNKENILKAKIDRLEELYFEIDQQLYGKKRKKKKKSSHWREQELYKDFISKQKAGELV